MRSQTLHRKAVAKPLIQPRPQSESRIVKPTFNPGKARLERAASTQQSEYIGKFQASKKVGATPTAMQPRPAPEDSLVHEPPIYVPDEAVRLPASIIDRALETTPNNLQTAKKSKKSPKLAVALTALAIGLGVIGYLNLPRISLSIASRQAGFSAHMPDTPAGFSIDGPIRYETGKVSISMASNTDSRNLQIVQQPTSLDSASLASGYFSNKDIPYQTVEVNGKTIYIYNGNSAIWVSQGIRYQLEGESGLSSDQIVEIAKSL